ncbi:MAG: phytochrome sensor protein [bacterium]|nr:MAG: phytochrome sensor protein [bacterium]
MPEYQYRAVDEAGRNISGTMTSVSVVSLEANLQKSGYWLLEAKERGASVIAGAFESRGANSSKRVRGSVKRRELIDFCQQVSSLLEAGVTLLETLKTLSGDADNPYFKQVLEDISAKIESGEHIYVAMSEHPKVFAVQMVSMVKAGEQSGTLPSSFNELALYLEWLEGLISDIRQATIYPATILVVLMLFVTVLYSFVVPKFVTLLSNMKVALPLPTLVVMIVSDIFSKYWWLIAIMAVTVPILVRIMRKRSGGFAYAWDKMKISLPVFGEMNKMFAISRFTHNFATLFRAGIPILQALDLCNNLVGNKVMEKALEDAKFDVEAGMMMSDTFRNHSIFPPMVLRMLAVGEATSDIGNSLDNVSKHYNQEIPRRLKKVFGIMEPAILLVLIGIVGFTALAIFMPILSIYSNIGG